MIDGITVISLTPREVSILCPPDSGNRFFLYFGVAALLLAGFIYYKWRSQLFCFIALLHGVFFLIAAAWSLTSVTTINASVDTGMLVVHNTVAGISTGRHTYRLTNLEGFRVGFVRGNRYLYADLADGYTSQMLPAGHQGGYQHAADALNSFLGFLEEETPKQAPSQ